MAKFDGDLRDIYFNLFEVLEVQNNPLGLEKEDIQGIVSEFEKFSRTEIFPTREESDHKGVHLTDEGVKVPEVLKAMHQHYYENGWFALGLPEKFEGAPVPEAVYSACSSLSSSANLAWGMYPGLTRGALNVLRLKGSEEQQQTYIPKMMTGEWGGTMCLTEPGAGSDVGALKTTAKPLDDGSYAINGVKIFISSGDNDLYENMVHLVLARTPEGAEGTKGISLFIVPKNLPDGNYNNVKCTKIEEKMGIHASATCELTFGQDGECKGYLIGEEFDGMATMFIMMNEARLLVALQGESQAIIAHSMARAYANERVQFKKPIISHPDVEITLNKMRAVSRGLRALCLYAAQLIDDSHDNEAAHKELSFLIPICKSYCSDQSFLLASDAVQVHGGYGFCQEYGVEQLVRDTKITAIYEGTNGIQAIDLVGRKILKDGGKTLEALSGKIMQDCQSWDDGEFSKEKALLLKTLGSGQEIMKSLASWAGNGDMNTVLSNATEIQNFLARIVVSWRLGIAAQKAMEAVGSASGEEKDFYQSKIDDFKTYCRYHLNLNSASLRTILY